jgi:TM2 domain-containing membrane protein YozV
MRVRACLVLLILFAAVAATAAPDYYSPASILLFADHLFQEQDFLRAAYEYERYLFGQDAEDPLSQEILYRAGKSFQCAGDYLRSLDLFGSLLESTVSMVERDRAIYEIGLTYFRMEQYSDSLSFLQTHPGGSGAPDAVLLSSANLMMLGQWRQAEEVLKGCSASLAEPLREIAREGSSMRRKSPLLAGILSSVVPGLGKIYAGEYGDGIQSLAFIGLFGTLSFLSFRSDGIDSIRGWIYASAGTLLHVGNIYGSVVSAGRFNRLQEETLLQDVRDTIPLCSELPRVP